MPNLILAIGIFKCHFKFENLEDIYMII